MNGREIGRGQFENAVASERNRMQQQLGDQFSELAANENYMKTMRQQVLNRLIDESLLDQYARELGLSISDEQVKQAIFQTQAFQTNGKFDNQRFSGIVAQMGMTTDQYAQALRNQLTTQQLINAIAGTDFMLPGESDQLAALVSQQRVVREATINVNALAAKQTASDEEINAFWQQNQARFMAPEQFRVSYIKMDAASMQESASDEEIQSWYDQHKDQFTQPQRNRYSVIQTKTEADAKAVLAELQKGRFRHAGERKIDRYYLCPQRRRYGVDGRGLYGARAERCRAERERPAVWRDQILGWLPGGPSGRRPAGAGEAAG